MSQSAMPKRFPLDNAAQIFVNIVSPGETTLSRISLEMKNPVNRERLQQAVNRVIPQRFPYYQVYLKKSFTAYVLEHTEDIPAVENDSYYTNRYVDFHSEKFLFRVRSGGQNIAVEMSHILSDGYGTLVLLLSVTAEYLRLGGVSVEESPLVFRPGDPVVTGEWECGYTNVFPRKGPPQKADEPAYIPEGTAIPFDRYYTARFQMDLAKVRAMAKKRGVTLVVLMSALYMKAIQQLYLEDMENGSTRPGRLLRLQIPVNLRRDYPNPSMKNFCYVHAPSYRIRSVKDALDTEQLITMIAGHIRHERHTRKIEHQIKRNLRVNANPFFRFMHRGLKERLLTLFYHKFARSLFSGVLTSLGELKLPGGIAEEVSAVDILACNSPAPGRNTTVFSYNGILEMSIGSTLSDTRLEDQLETELTQLEIEYNLISKRERSDQDSARA